MSEHVLFDSNYDKNQIKLLKPIQNVSELVYKFCLFLQNFGKNPGIVDGRTGQMFFGEERYEKFYNFYLKNYRILPNMTYTGQCRDNCTETGLF